MVKHGIILAICFMLYMIENIIAFTNGEKFDRLDKCFNQMYDKKLIQTSDGIIYSQENLYSSVMGTFFQAYSDHDDYLLIMNDIEVLLNSANAMTLINALLGKFVTHERFENKMDILKSSTTLPNPLMLFVANYSPTSPHAFYRSPRLFCESYMIDDSLDGTRAEDDSTRFVNNNDYDD